MVECASDADCHRLCGRHPLTSSHYSCQKRFKLFDYANISSDKAVDYITSTVAAGNVSDPREGMGICVDSNALLYQSCHNEQLANVVDVVVGCADRMIARFLCGLEVKTRGGDPITATLHGNLFYPRVLVAGSEDTEGDGVTAPLMECSDPIDCSTRCKYLGRTSFNGAGTPPTCALWYVPRQTLPCHSPPAHTLVCTLQRPILPQRRPLHHRRAVLGRLRGRPHRHPHHLQMPRRPPRQLHPASCRLHLPARQDPRTRVAQTCKARPRGKQGAPVRRRRPV